MGSTTISLIKKFSIFDNPIQLERQISPKSYCENVGRKAAILGYESGTFEVWVYPFKIISDLQFSVSIPHYDLVVHGRDIAKRIIARPEMTTLIFSHDLFTIQWHLVMPLEEPGSILLFDIDTYTSIEIWVSFLPQLIPMWPAGLGGQYTLWLEEVNGYYIGESSKKYVGLIGVPMARQLSNTPGHQLPDDPLKLAIKISRATAIDNFIPIIITSSSQGKDKAVQQFIALLNTIPQVYQTNFNHYQCLRTEFMTIQTPVPDLDLAYEWAKVSLDKGRVENPHSGKGLVAGYGVSGKSHRPGFAWFFGGDTCLNSLAINGYGDFETTKQSLIILREHQRKDGKIFHELTQSAALLNWFQDYPYGFYHAETSAFYIVAMHDYFIHSGDESFIQESWNSIKMAYHYCLTADEDHDGLMENSAAGLAAMEVGEMLKQNRVDIYLAAIWLQALRCMIYLSEFFAETTLAEQCTHQFKTADDSFNRIFVDEEKKQLNFALLINGDKHSDQTVWQAMPLFFNLIEAEKVNLTMQQFASSEMSTDWGVRGVSQNSKYYDPVSYNHGSVWPFTTGYVATAQYKHHRTINGYHNLMANAELTWLDALGWQTELLSGEYYRPVSTAIPHQLFSATGIINPLILGLLGLESNVIDRQLKFTPHLPVDWNVLDVKNFRCGQDYFDISVKRSIDQLQVRITHRGNESYQFVFSPALGLKTDIESVFVNQTEHDYHLHITPYDIHCEIEEVLSENLDIEIKYKQGLEFAIPLPVIKIGGRTIGLKLIDYKWTDNILTINLEGLPGNEYMIYVTTGLLIKYIEGAKLVNVDNQIHELKVAFRPGSALKPIKRVVRLYF